VNIRIPTRVKKLEEKKRISYSRKDKNGEAITIMENLGWFVHFEGSWEALFVGYEKPEGLETGSEVDIIIQPRKARP
jgi:hypothetical protein